MLSQEEIEIAEYNLIHHLCEEINDGYLYAELLYSRLATKCHAYISVGEWMEVS